MVRFLRILVLCIIGAAQASLADTPLPPPSPSGQTPAAQALTDARAACATDVQKLCSGVPSGGGRILACLNQHASEVSPGCKQAITKATERTQANAETRSAAAPAAAEAPAPTAQPEGHPAARAAAAPGELYYRLKRVQIVDQAQGKPAYDLLIPTTWQFKGWVNVGVAEGGCFADWFSVVGDAKSADNSLELQILPQYTWQYADDPAIQREMQQQGQQDARFGMKPCPVRAPVPAAQFLRQDLLAKYRKGKTVVSVEPFPELDQITRHRLGLGPVAAGGTTGSIRTDAARARVAYVDDRGQPVEEWVAAAIIVRTVPTGGRGAAYDWHAVNVLFLRAPKGKLDANEKLFKLIASTIHPEPQWRDWSNGVIATLYRKKQQEQAKQSQMLAQFQAHVAETINGVVANQVAGSNAAVAGQDRLIRGVQVFRDPKSGATLELSNQYDHAWLNGSNEYVMSDDPSFTPKGTLDGNWTQLQLVR